MKRSLFFLLSVYILLFVGCASSKKPSLSYQAGYKDGCEVGREYWENSLVAEMKYKEISKKEPLYKNGWLDGLDSCYEDVELEVWMERP
ncbi:MAG: hypothetical protein L3J42_02615 [Hydrogenimonas sp.]|nr:hypothetical protein [Hydrogenimonas sp.]